jgi:hypothetical protein
VWEQPAEVRSVWVLQITAKKLYPAGMGLAMLKKRNVNKDWCLLTKDKA